MTDTTNAADANADLEFEEGRYLYCAVRADADESFSAEGIEDGTASLLVRDGIGVVVQSVDSVYDSDDMTRVRSWLLAHQQVVDEAGQRFGTPLPFRFDTIIKGDDGTVAEWLAERRGEIADALDSLSGHWEYRIEVRWDEASIRESVLEGDEELRELAERTEEASEGTGYLLEKQYEQRLRERLQDRRDAVSETLYEEVEPYAVEVQRADGGNASGVVSSGVDDDLDRVAQLSVLAPRENEEAIGEALEELAGRPDHEVRYTGPWPPYSYAPPIGGEGE